MVTVEIPPAIDGGAPIKRGVIDRAALIGERDDAAKKRPTLLVSRHVAPNVITLLPSGKGGDTSKPLDNRMRDAPDVVRKVNLKLIKIVEE